MVDFYLTLHFQDICAIEHAVELTSSISITIESKQLCCILQIVYIKHDQLFSLNLFLIYLTTLNNFGPAIFYLFKSRDVP